MVSGGAAAQYHTASSRCTAPKLWALVAWAVRRCAWPVRRCAWPVHGYPASAGVSPTVVPFGQVLRLGPVTVASAPKNFRRTIQPAPWTCLGPFDPPRNTTDVDVNIPPASAANHTVSRHAAALARQYCSVHGRAAQQSVKSESATPLTRHKRPSPTAEKGQNMKAPPLPRLPSIPAAPARPSIMVAARARPVRTARSRARTPKRLSPRTARGPPFLPRGRRAATAVSAAALIAGRASRRGCLWDVRAARQPSTLPLLEPPRCTRWHGRSPRAVCGQGFPSSSPPSRVSPPSASGQSSVCLLRACAPGYALNLFVINAMLEGGHCRTCRSRRKACRSRRKTCRSRHTLSASTRGRVSRSVALNLTAIDAM